jgi:hypothetical protein
MLKIVILWYLQYMHFTVETLALPKTLESSVDVSSI